MSKLVDYQIFKLEIPLKRPFITSIRNSKSLKGIFCRIRLDSGRWGFGESAENVKLTGETCEDMYRFAKDFFDEHLHENIEETLLSLQVFSNHNAARYGMETAILDAIAKSKGIEISTELELELPERNMPNDTTISLLDSEQTILETKRVLNEGYRHIKYKVDNGPDEVERILQLTEIIPQDVLLRIDPNQSWDYQQTMAAIRSFDESSLNIEFIEQPVKLLMYDDMKKIAQRSTIPIVADESVFNLEDAKNVIQHGYGTMLNLKLIKCGGPLEAIEIAKYAKKYQVECLFGCTTETNLALTMAAYLSLGLENVKYIDLDGLDYIEDSPFNGGIQDQSGVLTVPEQKDGLGINLIPNKVNHYLYEYQKV